MEPGFVDFGDVARQRLDMQCQYARHYLDVRDYPELAEGIRWYGELHDYHNLRIWAEHVDTFVDRVLAYRRAKGIIA